MGGGFRLDNRQRSSDNLRGLFSILFSGYEMAKPPLKKMAPKRKCKFNDYWRRIFAWIAKLLDNGMVQCNLCATLLVFTWLHVQVLISLAGFCVNVINISTGTSKMLGTVVYHF